MRASSGGRGVARHACQTTPLLGEKSIAARNSPVDTTTMLGPVGRSAWKDRYSPATVEMNPVSTLKAMIPGSRRAKSVAVAAGVRAPSR